MGFTLQHLKLCTTNSNWEAQFMDRTEAAEAGKPLYKILDIKNFGFYYKPNDTIFISELESEELREEQMISLFSEGKPRILSYSDSYLLEPMQLVVRLKLEAGRQQATVKLDIEKVDICMQKNQLVNICRLVELDHEYTQMQDAY